MTDLGLLHHFLGNFSGLFLSQRQYILDLLNRAGMLDCHPSHTSIDTSFKLSAHGDPFSDPTLSLNVANVCHAMVIERKTLLWQHGNSIMASKLYALKNAKFIATFTP